MKSIVSYIIILFAMVLCGACGSSSEDQEQQARDDQKLAARQDSAALKIATTPTLDCLPLFVGVADSTFQRAGVDVHLLARTNQMDGDTLIRGGHVEGFVTDLVRAERLKKLGTELRYVAATNAQWQIISNKVGRIKELKQLADKMIAITRFSATDMLADAAIDSVKPKNDVYRVQINDVNLRAKMLMANEVDAALLPEPQATQARRAGHPVLASSADKNLRLGVIAFREKSVNDKARQKQLDTFVKVYNAICDSINSRGLAHYTDIIKEYTGADEKTISKLPKVRYTHATPPRESDVDRAHKYAAAIGR